MTPVASLVRSGAGLSSTIAWAVGGTVTYALEGNITVTGSAIEWLGEFLGFGDPARQVAGLAASVPDAGGVYLVPAFAGLGAPHWDDGARALLFGMTRGTTAAHTARATLESIAFQVRDVFAAMEKDTGTAIPELLADGGATRNDQLMQFQADLLGRPVLRNRSTDLSARGAAYLAGLQAGVWNSLDEIASIPTETDRFDPQMSEDARRLAVAGWHDAVDRSRSRAVGRAAE
jgi:glycerol kinase